MKWSIIITLCLIFNSVIQAQNWQKLNFTPAFNNGKCGVYSPNGKFYVLGGTNALLLDAKSRKIIKLLNPDQAAATAITFSQDSSLMAIEYKAFNPPAQGEFIAHTIVIYEMPSAKIRYQYQGLPSHYNMRRKLIIDPENKKIASSNAKGIVVMDIKTGKTVWEWKWQTVKANNKTWSYAAFDCTPDWKYFLCNLVRISYPDKTIIDKCRWSEKRPFFWGNVISPDGKKAIAWGGINGSEQKLFDLETGKLIKVVKKFTTSNLVTDSAFTQVFTNNGSWSITDDKMSQYRLTNSVNDYISLKPDNSEISGINIYTAMKDLLAGKNTSRPKKWLESGFSHNDISFNAKNELVTSDYFNNYIYNFKTGTWRQEKKERKSRWGSNRPQGFDWTAKAFSPDEKVAASDRGEILYHKDTKKKKVSIFPANMKNKPWGIPFFLSNERLLFRARQAIFTYDLKSKKLTTIADKHGYTDRLKFTISPDRKLLISVDGDWKMYDKKQILVYDAKTLKLIKEIAIAPAGGVAFSPDSQQLVVYYGKTVDCYHIANWAKTSCNIANGSITKAVFSPDQQLLLLLNSDEFNTIIDLKSKKAAYYVFSNKTGKKQCLKAK